MTITSGALLNYLSYHKDNHITILIFEYLFGEYYGSAFGESFKYYHFYLNTEITESLAWMFIPSLITNVKNTSMQIYQDAVSVNGHYLQHFTYQIEEICLKAVQEDGRALKYVLKQTELICLKAVQQHGLALQLVQNQTELICLKAVQQDGRALYFVQNQTEEMCLKAVQQNGESKIKRK